MLTFVSGVMLPLTTDPSDNKDTDNVFDSLKVNDAAPVLVISGREAVATAIVAIYDPDPILTSALSVHVGLFVTIWYPLLVGGDKSPLLADAVIINIRLLVLVGVIAPVEPDVPVADAVTNPD
jgi:hypothetical protein